MFLCTNIFLMVWLLENINELLLQCVHWAKRKCACFPELLHKAFIVPFLKILFRDLVKNLNLLALFILWLIALYAATVRPKKWKFIYLTYKYKHLKFVFKLRFYLSCILCLETRLHELRTNETQIPMDLFFHSCLSFDSRSMIWGYSCYQKFPFHQPLFPPLSLLNLHFSDLWAAEPVETLHLFFVGGWFGGEGGWEFLVF